MSLLDDMQHSISVYRAVTTLDASGADIVSWVLRTANVPCLICQGAGGERNEFDQTQFQRSTHTIAFGTAGDGGIQRGDQLVDDNTGAVYRYTGGKPQQGYGGIPDFNIITVTEVG